MISHITFKKNYIPWLFFISILCVEFIIFRHRFLTEIANYYPVGYDQTSYLIFAYNTYENIQHFGLIAGLHKSAISTNGLLFPLQAVLSFSIFGVSRFSALLPNIFYFFALQGITLYVLSGLTNKKYLLLWTLGFILCLKSPVQLIGGIFDFRMDFIAFCLYGMMIASIIQSKIFLDKRWSFYTCGCIVLMILMRAITLTYVIGVMGCMTIYLFYVFKTSRNISIKNDYKIRLLHCFSIFITLICIILAYVLFNYQALYQYYVVGHFLGSEKQIRAVEAGVHNIYQTLKYYPSILIRLQIGHYAYKMLIIFFAIYLFSLLLKPKQQIKKYHLTENGISFWRDGFIFLLISLFIPLTILTMDTAKSSVVGSILVMPVLWLVLWIIFFLDRYTSINKPIFYLLNIIAIYTLTIGFHHQLKESTQQHRIFDYPDLVTLNQLYTDIGLYTVKQHGQTVSISTDRVADYNLPNNVIINYYEKYGQILNINSTLLGSSIFAAPVENLINALKKSKIVIFNISNNYPSYSPYPADMQIAKFKPLLIKYVDTHFDRLGDYKIGQSIYRVYVAKN